MSHILISAAHKSSGKTTVSLGLSAALSARGLTIQPFKKGPDYIDPMWLALASGRPCHNLDFYTMPDDEIVASFNHYNYDADIGLIEGNHGLYDSVDIEGTKSNAAIAKLLNAPVVLVVDVHGATRSVVPLILGYQQFDPELRFGGLILSKVANARHASRLRAVIEHYCDIPVLGTIERDERLVIDERHLGLMPSNEAETAREKIAAIAEIIGPQVDLDAVINLARSAELPQLANPERYPMPVINPSPDLRIGIARDAAFGFYYPADLERLREAGAELVAIDMTHDPELPPDLDALIIGGGFPETQMAELSGNRSMRESVRTAIEGGLPCYAECGGLMYLSRSVRWDDQEHEMVGVVPADTLMHKKPQGRGYMRLVETEHSPWPGGHESESLYAHEFHYSSLENMAPNQRYAYKVLRGSGIDGDNDGFIYKNLLANYVHMRDVAGNHWTRRFVEFVRRKHNQTPSPLAAAR